MISSYFTLKGIKPSMKLFITRSCNELTIYCRFRVLNHPMTSSRTTISHSRACCELSELWMANEILIPSRMFLYEGTTIHVKDRPVVTSPARCILDELMHSICNLLSFISSPCKSTIQCDTEIDIMKYGLNFHVIWIKFCVFFVVI